MVAQLIGWIEIIDAYDFDRDQEKGIIDHDIALELARGVGAPSALENIKSSSLKYGGQVFHIAENFNHLSQMVWYFRWIELIGKKSNESQAVLSFVDSDPKKFDFDQIGFSVKPGEYWICSLSYGKVSWFKNPFQMFLN